MLLSRQRPPPIICTTYNSADLFNMDMLPTKEDEMLPAAAVYMYFQKRIENGSDELGGEKECKCLILNRQCVWVVCGIQCCC